MEKSLVSVIMGVYNAENRVSDCIESIINQTYKNWEFIICDDCSTDDTIRFLKKYIEEHQLANWHILEKEKNKGGTQKFVSLGIIRKIKIITPPIELQNQFADFVKHIDKLKFTLKQTLEKLENCYHSLMQEYFE